MSLIAVLPATHLKAEDVEGFTEPYRDVDVAASEMGSIVAVDVKEGDRVRAGQVLARLEENSLQASLEIAKAEMNSTGKLDSAQAELNLQVDLLKKLKDLRERNFANPQEVERTLSEKNIAEARVKAVREELAVKALELRRIETQLERRRLASPIDGIVTSVRRDPGEFVSPNDPVVVKVVQLDPLLVVFSVPRTKAGRIEVGKPIRVRVDGIADPIEGLVEFTSPTADPQSGTTRVRVRVPNPQEQIPCGVNCRLTLTDVSSAVAAAKQ